ncbi:MAG: NAD-dependent epimerase/dehydratase family protein [Desulfobacter sp.]|nr:MAG: NAD-dependent epimerase/dehydratase family protein [Desulfobacter sp.]
MTDGSRGEYLGKTLVTGATGFTGFNLCRRLMADGEIVTAFVRKGPKVADLERLGVECRIVDITDPDSVMDNFEDIDTVYHIAAAYRTEHSDKEEFHQVNVLASGHLLEAAFQNNVKRFVHCSTVGVQGEIDKPPATEDYRIKPGDHYQRSKLEGEKLAIQYYQKGLSVSVVRPVGIYGPGDTRFLKLFRPISKGLFVMIGSGNVLYHMTYIDDLIEGIVLCGRESGALGEIFTIGGETYTTLSELCNLIADILNKPRPMLKVPYKPVFAASVICEKFCNILKINPVLFPRRVEFFALDRAFSINKAKRILGYEPKVSLQEGIRKTARWYIDNKLISE